MRTSLGATLLTLGLVATGAMPAVAQMDYRGSDEDREAAVWVTEEALRLITEEDFVGLTDLMIEGTTIVSIVEAQGETRRGTRTPLFARATLTIRSASDCIFFDLDEENAEFVSATTKLVGKAELA